MIVVADLLLLAAGFGLVRLVCPGPWPFGVAGGLGASFLAGCATLAFVVTVLGVLGLALWPAAVVLAALALAGLLRGLPRADGGPTAGVAGLLAGGFGGALAVAAASSRVILNDEYAIWGLRGRGLSLVDGLGSPAFTDGAAQYQHLDYPLLVPSLIAWADRWSPGPLDGVAHLQIGLLAAAMLAVVAWAVARLAGRFAAVAAVVLALVPTGLAAATQRLYADLPATTFAIAALLLLALWLRDEDDTRLLRVATIAAAGALYCKNEGALFALSALALAWLLARRRRHVALAALAALAAYAPWTLWTRAHDIHSDVANRQTLAPGRLWDNLDRLGPIWDGMTAHWPAAAWALPLAFVAAALAVRAGHLRLVGLAVGTTVLSLAGLAFVYVATPLDLAGHLESSAARVQLYPALVVVLSIPLFAGLASRGSAPPSAS